MRLSKTFIIKSGLLGATGGLIYFFQDNISDFMGEYINEQSITKQYKNYINEEGLGIYFWKVLKSGMKHDILPNGSKVHSSIGVSSGIDVNGDLLQSFYRMGWRFFEIGPLIYGNEVHRILNFEEVFALGDSKTEILLYPKYTNGFVRQLKNNILNFTCEGKRSDCIIGAAIIPSLSIQKINPFLSDTEIMGSVNELAHMVDFFSIDFSSMIAGSKKYYSEKAKIFDLFKILKEYTLVEIGVTAGLQHEAKMNSSSSGESSDKLLIKSFHNFYDKNEIKSTPRLPKMFAKFSINDSNYSNEFLKDILENENVDGIILCNTSFGKNDSKVHHSPTTITQEKMKELELLAKFALNKKKIIIPQDFELNGCGLTLKHTEILKNGPYMLQK